MATNKRQATLDGVFMRQQKPKVKRIKVNMREKDRRIISKELFCSFEQEKQCLVATSTTTETDDGNTIDLFASQDDVTQVERVESAQSNIVHLVTDHRLSDDSSFFLSTPVIVSDTETNSSPLITRPLQTIKQVKDRIYGLIPLPPLCCRIIDTQQFQRLRHLHQLGTANYVYIGATHSRFEHSLGVGYLAERMIRTIQQQQPYLPITEIDILCLQIAGLCHDLGHGPFSHVFDGIYMQELNTRQKQNQVQWTHEQGSIALFDYLLQVNAIDVSEYGLSLSDVIFIKECIYGGPLPGYERKKVRGRPHLHQRFLYDIVNNATSGLDVDKLDYFIRDSTHVGVNMTCDMDILISSARVLPDRDDPNHAWTICFPEKHVHRVMSVFTTRFELHQTVYQHKNIRAAEYMICDALLAADEYLLIKGKRISESMRYPHIYQHVDDRILARIESSESESLASARLILERLNTREFYKCIGKTVMNQYSRNKTKDEIFKEIWSFTQPQLVDQRHQVIVEFLHIHHGQKGQDPVQFVRFYSKSATQESFCYQLHTETYHKPFQFEEKAIRLFVKEPLLIAPIRRAFEKWCTTRNQSIIIPSTLEC